MAATACESAGAAWNRGGRAGHEHNPLRATTPGGRKIIMALCMMNRLLPVTRSARHSGSFTPYVRFSRLLGSGTMQMFKDFSSFEIRADWISILVPSALNVGCV